MGRKGDRAVKEHRDRQGCCFAPFAASSLFAPQNHRAASEMEGVGGAALERAGLPPSAAVQGEGHTVLELDFVQYRLACAENVGRRGVDGQGGRADGVQRHRAGAVELNDRIPLACAADGHVRRSVDRQHVGSGVKGYAGQVPPHNLDRSHL